MCTCIGLPRNERGCATESGGLLLHGAEGEGAQGVHDDEVDGGEHVGASGGELVQACEMSPLFPHPLNSTPKNNPESKTDQSPH